MVPLTLGLEVAFYLYPVGLFLALFASQLIAYRYRNATRSPGVSDETVTRLRKIFTNLIYAVQLILTPTLVCLPLGD